MPDYPERFLDLLDGVPLDGRVLDDGSGGRVPPDDRIVSLDLAHTPRNHLTADGCALPFPDATFDLVLSQAVLEHTPTPDAYIAEVLRVLVPGGILYVEAAFAQPLHLRPSHFYGITVHGLEWLLRRFDVLESGTLGYLHELWAWILDELDAGAVMGRGAVANQVAQLKAVDELGDPGFRDRFCSGVWATAIKETP